MKFAILFTFAFFSVLGPCPFPRLIESGEYDYDTGEENVRGIEIQTIMENKECVGCVLLSYDFSHRNLSGFDFSHSIMDNSKFNHSKLVETKFYKTSLKRTDFTKAEFKNTSMRGANLTDAQVGSFSGTLLCQTTINTGEFSHRDC